MSESAIVGKLQKLIEHGIADEQSAVYLLVEVRKLLEQSDAKELFPYLTFHCDWGVHARLKGRTAQKILQQFDEAAFHLQTGVELSDLPNDLRREVEAISQMKSFEKQLTDFMHSVGLMSLDEACADGWVRFLYQYGLVVEDCPLVMSASNAAAHVASVTLKLQTARQLHHGEIFFEVSWVIEEKNGGSGEIFVINSFAK